MISRGIFVFGALVVIAASIAAWHAFYPSKVWILEPADSQANANSSQILAELEARMPAVCSSGSELQPVAQGRIEVRLAALCASSDTEALLTRRGRFSMRFVELVQTEEAPSFRPTSGVLVTNDDVQEVWVSKTDVDGYVMNATFTARGASALEQATQGRVGQQLALILDGQVMTAPILSAPLGRAVAWPMKRRSSSRKQDLDELRVIARLMRAPAMEHALRVVRRPE